MPTDPAHLQNPAFRYRDKELALIQDCWNSRQSVLLTGIRRTGKSWVAKEALVRHAKSGGQIGFLNVQDYTSLHDFYRDLLREMPKSLVAEATDLLKSLGTVPDKLIRWWRGHVAKIDVPEVGGIEFQAPESLPRYWQPLVEVLGQVLSKHPAEKLPVLCIDELPFLLENLINAQPPVPDAELTVALASLRKLRDAGLRMIIAGSISMENLLSLHSIPDTVLGGMFRLPIRPFDLDEAEGYLVDRLKGKPAAQAKVIQTTLDTLPDYVPEFMNIASLHLSQLRSADQTAAILENDVLPSINRSFLKQFDERLTKHYTGDELKTAEVILDKVARAKPAGTRLDGSQLPAGHQRVLQMLEYDNFILRGADFRWSFALNLLRQWWRAERGMK
jgi:hypothetical protein